MFGISFNTWRDICNMYLSLPPGSTKAYLQWFPFTKLSDHDKKELCKSTNKKSSISFRSW